MPPSQQRNPLPGDECSRLCGVYGTDSDACVECHMVLGTPAAKNHFAIYQIYQKYRCSQDQPLKHAKSNSVGAMINMPPVPQDKEAMTLVLFGLFFLFIFLAIHKCT